MHDDDGQNQTDDNINDSNQTKDGQEEEDKENSKATTEQHEYIPDLSLYATGTNYSYHKKFNFRCSHGEPQSVVVKVEENDAENYATV